MRLAGRDLVLLGFEGNTGTGVFQELLLIAGVDNAGRLRILGIETLSSRENSDCALAENLGGPHRGAPGWPGAAGPLRRGRHPDRCLPGPARRPAPLAGSLDGDAALDRRRRVAAGQRRGRIGSVARRLDEDPGPDRRAGWPRRRAGRIAAGEMDRLRLYDTFCHRPGLSPPSSTTRGDSHAHHHPPRPDFGPRRFAARGPRPGAILSGPADHRGGALRRGRQHRRADPSHGGADERGAGQAGAGGQPPRRQYHHRRRIRRPRRARMATPS